MLCIELPVIPTALDILHFAVFSLTSSLNLFSQIQILPFHSLCKRAALAAFECKHLRCLV